MIWDFYLRDGIVYIPSIAKTEAGFSRVVEPVEVVAVGDAQSLEQALKRTIERGNPRIPTPPREEQARKPIILRYAKVKTWAAFAKTALPWNIEERDQIYTIAPLKEAPGKPYKGHPGWVVDKERAESLPPDFV
jgi:hypothetical protein